MLKQQYSFLFTAGIILSIFLFVSCNNSPSGTDGKTNTNPNEDSGKITRKDSLARIKDSNLIIVYVPEFTKHIENVKYKAADTIRTDSMDIQPMDSNIYGKTIKSLRLDGGRKLTVSVKTYYLPKDIIKNILSYTGSNNKEYTYTVKTTNIMYDYTVKINNELLFHKQIDFKTLRSKYLPHLSPEMNLSEIEVLSVNEKYKRIVFTQRFGYPPAGDQVSTYYYAMDFEGNIISSSYHSYSFGTCGDCAIQISGDNNTVLSCHQSYYFPKAITFKFDTTNDIAGVRFINDTTFLAVYFYHQYSPDALHNMDNAYVFSVKGRKLASFTFDGWVFSMGGPDPVFINETDKNKLWLEDDKRGLIIAIDRKNPLLIEKTKSGKKPKE